MRYRKLGRTNFEVSDIGYGAWGIGGKQWLGGSDDASRNTEMDRSTRSLLGSLRSTKR